MKVVQIILALVSFFASYTIVFIHAFEYIKERKNRVFENGHHKSTDGDDLFIADDYSALTTKDGNCSISVSSRRFGSGGEGTFICGCISGFCIAIFTVIAVSLI